MCDSRAQDLEHVPGLALDMRHTWKNDPLKDRCAVLELCTAWKTQTGSIHQTSAEVAEAVCAFAREHHPDFLRVTGRFDTWHIRDLNSGQFLSGFEHWDRVEGGLIRHILAGPLSWFTPAHEPAPVIDQSIVTSRSKDPARRSLKIDGAFGH